MNILFYQDMHWDWVECCVRVARHFNPEARIVLSTLQAEKYSPLSDVCEVISAVPHYGDIELVKRHVRNIKDSMYDGGRIGSLSQWLIWKSMLHQGIIGNEEVFALDSDMMLFCNAASEFESKWKPYDFSTGINDAFGVMQTPIIMGKGVLVEYCEFMHEAISQQAPWLKCAMSSSPEFIRQRNKKVGVVNRMIDGAIYDISIATSEGVWEMGRDGTKIFTFKAGIPYCRNTKTGEIVKQNWIHCFGIHKNKAIELYQRHIKSL